MKSTRKSENLVDIQILEQGARQHEPRKVREAKEIVYEGKKCSM